MKRSLRARLLFVVATVALISAAAVALLSRGFTRVELRRAEVNAEEGLRKTIVQARVAGDSWDSVRGTIASLSLIARTVVVDDQGRIVIAPQPELAGGTAERDTDGAWRFNLGIRRIALRGGEPLEDHGRRLGTLLLLPSALDERAPEQRIDRWLVWIVVIVGALGIALAILIGRSVARPLEQLTDAVDRVTRGDRTVRVATSAGGEVGTLASAFNDLLASLEHQESLRRTLVSDVAHELRSPLTNVRYHLEAMQDGVLPVDTTTLASCLEETLRLGRLVDDLQELALADAGALRIERCELDLRHEIDKLVQSTTARIQATRTTIEVDVDAQVRAVFADPSRLAQILCNLVDNAFVHTPEGGHIAISARAVSGGEVEVRITDDGTGIPVEHLSNVFERFYRIDPSRSRATGGAGLGLAIVKRLVIAHGGRVWAENTVDRGASLAFTLPAHS